jgi:hypothetical protein
LGVPFGSHMGLSHMGSVMCKSSQTATFRFSIGWVNIGIFPFVSVKIVAFVLEDRLLN